MTKFFIYPWKQNSKSAIGLAEELDGKRVLRVGSSYAYKPDHLLINWGCGDCPYPDALNNKIMAVINKTKFLDRLAGTGLAPAYTTSLFEAKALGYPVFCRTLTEGCDGQGIVIADCEGQLVSAPLYVKGVNKTAEFRVHIGRYPDGTIEILGGSPKEQKPIEASMQNVPADTRIWCGDTVYFGNFMKTEQLPMPVQSVCQQAFEKFPELTFVGFDVVYDSNTGTALIIEGNSAPMLTQSTRKAYGKFFRRYAELASLAKQVQLQPEPAPTPVAAPAAAAPMTVDSVMSDIAYEKIGMKTVIEGYINYVQGGANVT